MDPSEPGSAAEDEEEKLPEVRPRTRSNPEGAEDRAPSGLGSVGTRGDTVGTRGDTVGTRGEAVGTRGEGNRAEAVGNRAEAVGNRSEGEGEAASAGHSPPGQPGTAWHGPGGAQHGEVTVRTPRVNCPEKVIICLDLAEEMAVPKLESFNGQQKVELPVTDNVQTIPPPFVVRTILVFGRPRCQPHFCGGEHVKKLLQCPYFFFDVVYIHNGLDEKEDESSWKDMFGFFGSLDTKGTNYKYEVALAGPALELHNCMAKLLAHPLQRPCQSHAHYALLDGGDSPEGDATA
ncbi:BRISC and BRCA1-A complex member 1-like [Onychostruthus taczanowskii]|uniref:BRISC and BRCA1-A complex member 1-like n=1 Tax=Onychostruthus taczanowskii TaxID=356909 RepID=UPI001B8096C0|nr:BRISC and BRCA1-A complex member 1-like [Onychostruthus taczanowskii]